VPRAEHAALRAPDSAPAAAVANGTLKPGATSFAAGRLGTVKVESDNVILGALITFTAENIDKHQF